MKITSTAQLSEYGKLVFQMLAQSLQRLEQLGDEAIKKKAAFLAAKKHDKIQNLLVPDMEHHKFVLDYIARMND